jgi:phage-related tail fiber protein
MYNMPGEMRLKDRFVDVSNVQLLTDSEEVSRTKTEVRDGQKVRVLKKNNQVVTKNSLVTEAEAGTKTAKKSDKAKTTKKSTTKAKK